MNRDIANYNNSQVDEYKAICNRLAEEINSGLAEVESKIWHAHPVWFIDSNPIVGYSVLKSGVRLMFWSGMGFDEPDLLPESGKFKDASVTYTSIDQIDSEDIQRWLEKSKTIQWDYKNIVKRKGVLKRLK